MIKITIEEVVGELKTITTLETDNVDLAKSLLKLPETQVVVDVKQDVPNLMIDDTWKQVIKELQKRPKKRTPEPYVYPDIYPWTDDNFKPPEITC